MGSVDFFAYNIEISGEFNNYVDLDNKRLVFINDSTKEIIVAFEINQENELVIHPRVIQQLLFKEEKSVIIQKNELIIDEASIISSFFYLMIESFFIRNGGKNISTVKPSFPLLQDITWRHEILV